MLGKKHLRIHMYIYNICACVCIHKLVICMYLSLSYIYIYIYMVAPQQKNTVSNKNELFTVFYDILQQRTVHA